MLERSPQGGNRPRPAYAMCLHRYQSTLETNAPATTPHATSSVYVDIDRLWRTWQLSRCQSLSSIGTCQWASLSSAVRANVLRPFFAFSLILRLRSATIGARSWSRMRFLRFFEIPYLPSSLRKDPNDATTSPKNGNL